MWEFWRSKASKKYKSRPGSDSDSPSTARPANPAWDAIPLGPGMSPEASTHVFFKDLKLPANDSDEHLDDYEEGLDRGLSRSRTSSRLQLAGVSTAKRIDKQKLIIILVGLPGRGKTFLCNKLMGYLNWLGHPTRHFNVGQYRRKLKGVDEFQDAAFFDHSNPSGLEARHRALYVAIEEMELWLGGEGAQVAIFDATNSTEERRRLLRDRFHGTWQYLFIESICNDPNVLEQNYRSKMMYSPDYQGMDTVQAIEDFRARIRNYEEVYDTITDRDLHYIKLIDMVTGRGYMDVNRISGYIPGKMVFFLMQVCKVGLTRVRKIWMTRHGESEYNQTGKIGGDSRLSPRGEMYSKLLPELLVSRVPVTTEGVLAPVSVWTSTLRRTIQTALNLPFPKLRWKALDEIQAGIMDGMTYEEIAATMPDEFALRKQDKLRYRYPAGESYMDVVQRLEPVMIEMEREKECVCVVGHQAILRVLYGYFTMTPLESIPRLEIPLHTLIELTPRPDGTMGIERIPIDVDAAIAQEQAMGIFGSPDASPSPSRTNTTMGYATPASQPPLVGEGEVTSASPIPIADLGPAVSSPADSPSPASSPLEAHASSKPVSRPMPIPGSGDVAGDFAGLKMEAPEALGM